MYIKLNSYKECYKHNGTVTISSTGKVILTSPSAVYLPSIFSNLCKILQQLHTPVFN